jgi:hypothetical protein
MKPKPEEVSKAIDLMSQIIPNFPKDDLALEYLQRTLEAMVSTSEQLEWLTRHACNNMKWFSLAELRGIFCSRFAPADGIYGTAETPGYTPDEAITAAEREYQEREALEYERKLAEWKQEAKRLGYKPEPFLLPPGISEMPPAPKPPNPAKRSRRELPKAPAELPVGERRSQEESERLLAELERQLDQKKA